MYPPPVLRYNALSIVSPPQKIGSKMIDEIRRLLRVSAAVKIFNEINDSNHIINIIE